jgi:site-specific DNA recombinase
MSRDLQIALYARVSSAQQAEAGTIASQLSALRERVASDGYHITEPMEFIDDGYSGTTFERPALERLRDLAWAGRLDRLYVLDPDRLARKYAYQVVLVEEFERSGVEVVLLTGATSHTPEGDLLLQVQGMMAEYERAKILERTRRGKRYAAAQGRVNVLSGAPYGYRYIRTREGGGEACYQIEPDEASAVRHAFEWVGLERVSIDEVCRRLERTGVRTRAGKAVWNRSSVGRLLRNPAYKGEAAFGRTRVGPPRARLRPLRGHSGTPKQPRSRQPTPPEEWVKVAVPAIVSAELFDGVQEQLDENRVRARQRRTATGPLLAGLVVCAVCGYAYHGKRVAHGGDGYAYYCCGGASRRHGHIQPPCGNASVRAPQLDDAVWEQVCGVLEDPWRLEQEYRRRLDQTPGGPLETTRRSVRRQREQVARATARLIDAYTAGLIEAGEFEPRITALRERAKELDGQGRDVDEQEALRADLRLIIGCLEEFARRVERGLATAPPSTRRDIIRALVRRIDVDTGTVTVVFKVSQGPFVLGPGRGVLQHCPRRHRGRFWV